MQSPVMADSVVAIGACQLAIEVVEIEDNPDVINEEQSRSPPARARGHPARGLRAALRGRRPHREQNPDRRPRALGQAPDELPVDAADQAIVLAAEKFVVAEGKAERRPFRVQDGVAAVPL